MRMGRCHPKNARSAAKERGHAFDEGSLGTCPFHPSATDARSASRESRNERRRINGNIRRRIDRMRMRMRRRRSVKMRMTRRAKRKSRMLMKRRRTRRTRRNESGGGGRSRSRSRSRTRRARRTVLPDVARSQAPNDANVAAAAQTAYVTSQASLGPSQAGVARLTG